MHKWLGMSKELTEIQPEILLLKADLNKAQTFKACKTYPLFTSFLIVNTLIQIYDINGRAI